MSVNDWSPLDWTGLTLNTRAEPVASRCRFWSRCRVRSHESRCDGHALATENDAGPHVSSSKDHPPNPVIRHTSSPETAVPPGQGPDRQAMAGVTQGCGRMTARLLRSGRGATTRWARPGRRSRPTSRSTPPGHRVLGVHVRRRRQRDRAPADRASLGIWHGALPGIAPGTLYGYRADGPWEPDLGLRFNITSCCSTLTRGLSPAGDARSGDLRSPRAPGELNEDDSAPYVRAACVDPPAFDWGGDEPMHAAVARHGRSTRCTSRASPAPPPGAGAAPRHLRRARIPAVIDYLRLGVTGVELLPVHQFISEPAGRAWTDQLLGLQLDRLLRAAQRLLASGDRRRAGRRVQGDGEGIPRRRHRGHSRRRLQPHRRGRRSARR